MQVPLPEKSLGRWIISGGLGALGSLTTHWLACQGGTILQALCVTAKQNMHYSVFYAVHKEQAMWKR